MKQEQLALHEDKGLLDFEVFSARYADPAEDGNLIYAKREGPQPAWLVRCVRGFGDGSSHQHVKCMSACADLSKMNLIP